MQEPVQRVIGTPDGRVLAVEARLLDHRTLLTSGNLAAEELSRDREKFVGWCVNHPRKGRVTLTRPGESGTSGLSYVRLGGWYSQSHRPEP